VTAALEDLPDDVAALRALLQAERADHAAELADERAHHASELAERDTRLERLTAMLHALRRAQFGRRSEKLDPAQLSLTLEDLEIAVAAAQAEKDKQDGARSTPRRAAPIKRSAPLPAHLPRIEQVIEPKSTVCPCCTGAMHRIGEDRSERLDVIPAQYRVLVTRRPKYGCRACEGAVVQAPAPARLIEGGLPTEALVAHILVNKYANHLPLYRQWQILARQGIDIDRSNLALWTGRGAFLVSPVVDRMLELLKGSTKLFCDETRAPVLDPGRGRTKTGYLWAIARDDRPWGGADPPAVVYRYAPGRGSEHALRHLAGFTGVLQVDGYTGYNALADPARPGGPVTLAYCWSHFRRQFYDIAKGGNAPIADQALARIARLYAIEDSIRGQPALQRQAMRQQHTKPLVGELFAWLETQLRLVRRSSNIADAIRYGFNHQDGLRHFLEDGRIEIDTNTVERTIRPIALNRKNSLFAGHDEGGVHWGVVASLVETCKLNDIEPQAYLTDVLTKLVDGWPMRRIDELLPWVWARQQRGDKLAG
jgi:transposase